MLPDAKILEQSSIGHRTGLSFDRRPDWTGFDWPASGARPPSSTPDHLSDAPTRQQFALGIWATDYVLEHGLPAPRFATKNLWVLPRKWKMAEAFKVNYSTTSQGLIYPARSTDKGYLTVFESVDRVVSSIEIPDDYDAVRHALCQEGRWVGTPHYRGPPVPASRVAWMAPSNEARYLNGILGMAGSLEESRALLLHPFLRKVWGRLGATPELPLDKVRPTISRLQKRGRVTSAFELNDEGDREALGTLIVKAAQTLKSPARFYRYTDLASEWRVHRDQFWADNGSRPVGSPEVDWEEREQASLDECLIALRGRQMMFQGHEWTCPECHHRNWVDLSGLASQLNCQICKESVAGPIDLQWLFRANEFLIEAMRDRSVVSLIWVLGKVCDDARSSFIYAGPTWLWFDNPDGNPDAETDLLMIADGRTILCEAKSSWGTLRARDIDDLVSLAQRLKPDVALLAVMDTGQGQQETITSARERLKALDIEFSLMTLDTSPIRDDAYLY